MRRQRWLLFLVISIFLAAAGCSSSSDHDGGSSAGSEQTSVTTLADVMESQGLKLVNEVDAYGDKGYLLKFIDKSKLTDQISEGTNAAGNTVGPFPKYCVILTGKPYNMGYQSALLRPEQGYKMLTDFMKIVALKQFEMLGIKISPTDPIADEIYQVLYKTIVAIDALMEPDVPDNLRLEMQGFADGMQAAGYKTDPNTGEAIDYNHLLVINEAVDTTYFFLAAVLGYAKETDENKAVIAECRQTFMAILAKAIGASSTEDESVLALAEKAKTSFATMGGLLRFGCNELVLSGHATVNGETYHGRDFMFSTADIYQDAAAIVVYLPDTGYPFATVSVPGFVGQSLGLNIKGLSVGQDVCVVSFMGATPGVGSMFMVRDLVQNTSTIAQAIERVRNTTRGVSWIYFVAAETEDSTYGHGAELEAMTNQRDDEIGNGIDTLPLWLRVFFTSETRILDELDADQLTADGDIDRGVMVRGTAYQYPEDERFASQPLDLKDFSTYTDQYNSGNRFTSQIETYDDALVATNHYVIPRMRMLQFSPIINLIYGSSGQLAESVWRYENMITEIDTYYKAKIEYFGSDPDKPAVGSAGWMIDFLNTQRDYPEFYRDQNDDGEMEYPEDTWVDGHHAIMNNTQREMRALFGYMTDPWVGVQLQPFVDWYYGTDKTF